MIESFNGIFYFRIVKTLMLTINFVCLYKKTRLGTFCGNKKFALFWLFDVPINLKPTERRNCIAISDYWIILHRSLK